MAAELRNLGLPGRPCRSAVHPTANSMAAVCNEHSTSTPVVRGARAPRSDCIHRIRLTARSDRHERPARRFSSTPTATQNAGRGRGSAFIGDDERAHYDFRLCHFFGRANRALANYVEIFIVFAALDLALIATYQPGGWGPMTWIVARVLYLPLHLLTSSMCEQSPGELR